MDVPESVLHVLKAKYFEASGARAAVEIVRNTASDKLDRLLETHLLRTPSPSDVEKRHAVDALLEFYGYLEIASLVGCIPHTLPADLVEDGEIVMGNRYVRRYYEYYYPVLIQTAFYKRLSGEPVEEFGAFGNAYPHFQSFMVLADMTKREDVDLFLWMVDDGFEDGVGLSETLAVIVDPRKLAATLTRSPERRRARDLSVHGFFGLLEFAIEFDRLLWRMGDSPVLQSAMWHHFGYWFRQMDGQILGAIGVGIDRFMDWSSDAAAARSLLGESVSEDQLQAEISRSREQLGAAHRALKRLASSVYRGPLEQRMLLETPISLLEVEEPLPVIRIRPQYDAGV